MAEMVEVAVALGSSLKEPIEARTLLLQSIASEPSGLTLLEDVFPVTLLTRQSGAEVQMEHGHCATRADFVSFSFVCCPFCLLFLFLLAF